MFLQSIRFKRQSGTVQFSFAYKKKFSFKVLICVVCDSFLKLFAFENKSFMMSPAEAARLFLQVSEIYLIGFDIIKIYSFFSSVFSTSNSRDVSRADIPSIDFGANGSKFLFIFYIFR